MPRLSAPARSGRLRDKAIAERCQKRLGDVEWFSRRLVFVKYERVQCGMIPGTPAALAAILPISRPLTNGYERLEPAATKHFPQRDEA